MMNLNKMDKSIKKNKSEFEYFILFMISGFVSMKALAIYDTNAPFTRPDERYMYLAAIMLILYLYSATKCDMFNVFLLIRKIPNSIKKLYKYLIDDYKSWKMTGERNAK